MGDSRQIRYNYSSSGIGLTDDGRVFIDGVCYGRKEGNRIVPLKYENLTLIIDQYGYVCGAYDGKTYGKIQSIGVTDYLESSDSINTQHNVSNNDSLFLKLAEKYVKNSDTSKATGYSNSTGKNRKKIIIIALTVILVLLLFNIVPILIAALL